MSCRSPTGVAPAYRKVPAVKRSAMDIKTISLRERNWFSLNRNQETMMKREPRTDRPPDILRISCSVGNVMNISSEGLGGVGTKGGGEGGGEVPFFSNVFITTAAATA